MNIRSFSRALFGCVAALALGSGICPGQVLSTVGGAVTVGPTSSGYYQPKLVIDETLLQSLMQVQPPPALLGPDDAVDVELFGVKDFETKTRVERDGTVQLPYVGAIKVGGLTVSQAESSIAAALVSQNLVLQPAVKISVTDVQSATVLVTGEVPHPGPFPAYGNMTLDRLISAGGGILADASPVVSLVRKGYPAPIYVPLGPDPQHARYGGMPLLPGDRVTISKVGVYYVVGAIRNQGAYALKSTTPTTVAQALASAGGYGYEALLDDAQIVRTEGDHRVFVPVKAGKIMKGKTPDVALMNDDILFVPTSLTKAAIKSGATSLIVSLAQSYLYRY
jgi:polysaccharide export outer membrane protein